MRVGIGKSMATHQPYTQTISPSYNCGLLIQVLLHFILYSEIFVANIVGILAKP